MRKKLFSCSLSEIVSEMSDTILKPPSRLRRPSYFHPVADINPSPNLPQRLLDEMDIKMKSNHRLSGKVIDALMAQQQEGKLANSALGKYLFLLFSMEQ